MKIQFPNFQKLARLQRSGVRDGELADLVPESHLGVLELVQGRSSWKRRVGNLLSLVQCVLSSGEGGYLPEYYRR